MAKLQKALKRENNNRKARQNPVVGSKSVFLIQRLIIERAEKAKSGG